jgi:phosphoglycerate dehydrogenase-like enzyme
MIHSTDNRQTVRAICLTAALAILPAPAIAQSPDAQFEPGQTTEEFIARHGLREHSIASRDIEGWEKPQRILVNTLSPAQFEWLQRAVPDVELVAFEGPESARDQLDTFQAIVGVCDSQLVAPNIHWIQHYSAGIERCASIPGVREHVRILTNNQKTQGPQIADHAISLMMALVRQIDVFARRQSWKREFAENGDKVWELEGRTLLVVGLGGIGTDIARLGHGLGMRVIATRNSSRNGPDFVSYVGLADELLDLARQADVAINATPLTPSTTGIFNKDFFDALPNHAYFVSIGRGGSAVTDDLVAALENNEIAGVGLDVTDPEPLPDDHPLWTMPRVIITPHIAGASDKQIERIMLLVRENIRRYAAGDPLLSVVDMDRGY